MNLIKRTIWTYTNHFDTDFKNPFLIFLSVVILWFLLFTAWLTYIIQYYLFHLIDKNILISFMVFWSFIVMSWSFMILQLIHRLRFWRFFWLVKKENKTSRLFMKSVLYTLLIIAIQVFVLFSLRYVFWNAETSQEKDMNWIVLTLWLASLVMFPLIWMFEEFIFRWVLQQWIANLTKKIWNVASWILWLIISTSIFTALHYQQATNFELIAIFIVSLVLWIIYFVHKDLRLNMLIHWMNNLFFVSVVFASVIFTTWIDEAKKLNEIQNKWLNESAIFIWKQIWEDPYWIKYNAFSFLDTYCQNKKLWTKVIIDKKPLRQEDCKTDLNFLKSKLASDLQVLKSVEATNPWTVKSYIIYNYELILEAIEK